MSSQICISSLKKCKSIHKCVLFLVNISCRSKYFSSQETQKYFFTDFFLHTLSQKKFQSTLKYVYLFS